MWRLTGVVWAQAWFRPADPGEIVQYPAASCSRGYFYLRKSSGSLAGVRTGSTAQRCEVKGDAQNVVKNHQRRQG
jgi:hypothetical protein